MIVFRSSRSPLRTTCRSTTMPAAGRPRDVSNTCVESEAMLSPEPQTETAIRWAGVGIHAGLLPSLENRIPGSVVRLQMHLGDHWNLGQDLRADLIDDLLNASRFETGESVMNH